MVNLSRNLFRLDSTVEECYIYLPVIINVMIFFFFFISQAFKNDKDLIPE